MRAGCLRLTVAACLLRVRRQWRSGFPLRKANLTDAGRIGWHHDMNQDIYSALPHRPPFLFIDEIVRESDDEIVCRKRFDESEHFFAGHFPDFPIVPGVVLCEAAMQAGALLLARRGLATGGGVPVATRLNNVRFKQMVRPGDTVEMEVHLDESLSGAFFLTAKVTCEGRMAARLEFACTLAKPEGEGGA